MDKKRFEQLVKAYFAQFGFSERVLGKVIESLEPAELGELQEADVTELCANFEPIAKVFQSEIDTRVATAVSKAKPTAPTKPTELTPTEGGDVPAWAKALTDKVEALQTELSVKNNNTSVEAKLKEVGFTDTEIKATMFGRAFNSQEEIDEFVSVQAELKADLDKERKQVGAGDGVEPYRNNQTFSKSQREAQLNKFIEKKKAENNLN